MADELDAAYPFDEQAGTEPAGPDEFDEELNEFATKGLNRQVDQSADTITFTDLRPASLLAISQGALPNCEISSTESNSAFTHRGFQQTSLLTIVSKGADLPRSIVLTILQCNSYDDAYGAFCDQVASFQRNWSDVVVPTTGRAAGIGNYAFETSEGIFWTRWYTFISIQYVETDQTGSDSDISDLRTIAMSMDQSFVQNRGSRATRARVGPVDPVRVPSLVVGTPTVVKINFLSTSHNVKSVEFSDSIVTDDGGVSSGGEIELIPLESGTCRMVILTADAISLLTYKMEVPLTVTAPQAA